MSVRFVLDTSTISAAMWPSPPQGLLHKLGQCVGSAAVPTPVWHELRYGCALLPEGTSRRDALERFLEQMVLPFYPILDYDRPAAEWHARERARLRQVGRVPPFADSLIASIAASRGATLVTANTADFEIFAGITLVDWT